MAIERKYLIHKLPDDLDGYPRKKSSRLISAPVPLSVSAVRTQIIISPIKEAD